MDKVWNFLAELATTAGVRLLLAIVVLVIGLKLIKWTIKIIAKGKGYQKMEAGVQSFFKSFLNIVLDILLFITVASIVGIPITSFVTLLASAGVAIGLALQGALSNLAGGLMILIFRPFKVGDFIEANGHSGTVRAITVFYTILVTPDNKHVTMPNGSLTNSSIVNYSSEDTRRLDLTYSVSYDADIGKVKQLLLQAAETHQLVRKEPAPMARLKEHGDSSLNFLLRIWCRSGDYWTVQYDLLESVKTAFDQEGISIPYPQLDIHLKSAGTAENTES